MVLTHLCSRTHLERQGPRRASRSLQETPRSLQFPPNLRCVADALSKISLWFRHLMKKLSEKWSGQCCKIESEMEAKWVHKLHIIWILPPMKGGYYRSRQHVSTNYESQLNTDPEKLDFGVLSRARVQFSLFKFYSECDQIGTQMGFKLVCVGAFEPRKLAEVGFRKHGKKRHQQSRNICSNMLQNEGPKKWSFSIF